MSETKKNNRPEQSRAGMGGQAERPEADAVGDGAPLRQGLPSSAPQTQKNMTDADRRKARAAAKLRENLLKRKQQTRARRAGQADETVGLPAAKLDESS